MVSVLLEFLLPLRFHGQANVRRAVLYALAQGLGVLPASVLVSTLGPDLIDELYAWLPDAAKDDPDEQVRALAGACIRELAAAQRELRGRIVET